MFMDLNSTVFGIIAIFLLFLGVLCFTAKAKQAYTGPLSQIPGPSIARWTNLRLKLHVLIGERVHYVQKVHEKYGPVVLISPTEIAISDLEATKAIHKVNSGFVKSPWYQKLNKSAHPGIFAMIDVREHANRRGLIAQSFSNSNLLKWEDVVRTKADLAVRRIREEAERNGQADILKWFTFMATDLIGQLSFRDSFRMLEQGKKNEYIEDVESALVISGINAELPAVVSLLSLLPISSLRRIKNVHDKVAQYGVESVQRHKRQVLAGELGNQPTFFSKIFAAGKSQVLLDGEIEQEASNLIVAGSDTTAVTATYLVWAVVRNPEVHHQVCAELQDLPSPYKGEDLARLPYFNAAIKEILRLYGAAPGGLPRIVPPGGMKLGGYFIPEGVTVTTQAYTLHRDPNIFDEPNNFKPARWLNPTPQMEESFMPFRAGSRICIGLHRAHIELSLACAGFLREFPNARVSNETPDSDMAIENYFLIAPKGHRCLFCI